MTTVMSPQRIQEYGFQLDSSARARLLGQRPAILWFTGLSGAGKSTIANNVEITLHRSGQLTQILDGDSIRRGLCKDLGFSNEDRRENVRRLAEVAKLMADTGVIVLVCCISPLRAHRELAKHVAGTHRFAEIYLQVPLSVAESRDPKGLFRLARSGMLPNFTGIDSPYEPPTKPDVLINSDVVPVDQAANAVVQWLATH